MNIAVTAIGAALVIIGIVLTVYSAHLRNKNNRDMTAGRKKLIPLCFIVGAVVFVFGFCFEIVPTGYTGVKTTFGQVSEQTMPRGFNLKIPFVQSIKLVNNKQQDTVLSGEVWGETSEKTPVFASDIIVTYQISSERSAWIYANVSSPDRNLIDQSLLASSVKSAMIELGAKDVTNRSVIEPMVKEKLAESLSEKYGENTVEVLKVVINNMDFEESYNEAIAAKSVAQQVYEKQQIENETAVAKAEADKQVAITNAEAAAEAERIAAQAEADANRLRAESLTDEVLRAKFYEKWDGKLPNVMGDNAVITDVSGEGK